MNGDHAEVQKLKNLNFFHPDLDRHKAECILLQNGQDGTFLIRNSSNTNEYAVSVRAANAVKHFLLFWKDNQFYFGHGTYKCLDDLEYHFSNKPLLGGESGQTTLLTDPYPREVLEPNIYEPVKVHAEYNTCESTPRKDFSINSKDGYLTKLGAFFKTWKVRWFILHNNELHYYKDSSHHSPIRVLDLRECLECEIEPAAFRGKQHVFRLVFSWRTFYMYAANKQETDDWVKVIKWRMDHNH